MSTDEPIRYIACGHFNSMLVTESNNIIVCGTNQNNILGVGKEYDRGGSVRKLFQLHRFDNIVDRVFVGAYHWFILTKSEELYFIGEEVSDRVHPNEHFASSQTHGEFIKCENGTFTRDLELVCGQQYTIARTLRKRKQMFSNRFVDSLLDRNEKAVTYVDIEIVC